MSAALKWEGLEEFRAALRQLPETLAHDAGPIITRYATMAWHTVQQDYPIGPGSRKYPPGNLKRGVTLQQASSSRFGAAARVRSGSPHASIFERGTVTRRTGEGANRGAMPKPPDDERMIPAVVRIRRRMIVDLVELVRKAGFLVSTPV